MGEKAKRRKADGENQPSAFMETTDAGGYHVKETNIGPLLPEHVIYQLRDPEKGLVINDLTFPAIQIEDALTAPLRQALADLVWGYMVLEPIKISSYADTRGSGIRIDERKRKLLACYEFVTKNLIWAHRRVLIDHKDSFVKLAVLDVGKSRQRREQVARAMADLGEDIIKRDGRTRAVAGYTGYIVACAEAVMALQHQFDKLWRRAQRNHEEFNEAWARAMRLSQRDVDQERVTLMMNELDEQIKKLKKMAGNA